VVAALQLASNHYRTMALGAAENIWSSHHFGNTMLAVRAFV